MEKFNQRTNSKHKVLYNVTRALVSLEIASLVVIAGSQIKKSFQ